MYFEKCEIWLLWNTLFSYFIIWNVSVFLTKHKIVRDPFGKCLPSSVGLPSTRMVVFVPEYRWFASGNIVFRLD